MNKIYFDSKRNLEVCDVSGAKTLEQIKREFNCPDLVDVTAEREAQAEANKLVAKETNDKEALIRAKMREQAIAELKKEGKLDTEGKMVAQIKEGL